MRAQTRAQRAYLTIRQWMTDGTHPTGSTLGTGGDIAVRLGIGRTTVIAVLRQLREEGWISSDTRRGYRVIGRP